MLRIGITGGLGSGKTTVARFFGDQGAQVFDADLEAKLILLRQRRLNDIIHPEVILAAEREMAAAIRRGVAMFVLDAPLLFEARLEQYLDYTLAVVADEELRVKRARERGTLWEADIRKRARLQLSDEERAARADFVVRNNGTLDELHEQLQAIYDDLGRNLQS